MLIIDKFPLFCKLNFTIPSFYVLMCCFAHLCLFVLLRYFFYKSLSISLSPKTSIPFDFRYSVVTPSPSMRVPLKVPS